MKATVVTYFKAITVFLVFWFVVPQHIYGQYYDYSGLYIEDTYGVSVNWVDIDGDGDLDASIAGLDKYFSGRTAFGKLYFFESSSIIDSASIITLDEGSMVWCDFNNDSIPDLLYTGVSLGDTIACIDTFSLSDTSYNALYSNFTPVTNASLDWGDYDNDGDYDVLIAGIDKNEDIITTLYQNNNGSFTDVEAGLPGITSGKIGFIDYDLDQDLDIFMSGQDINSNKYSRLWQNNNGTYSITNDLFLNFKNSHFDWGDINNDGYPDLLLGGNDGSSILCTFFYLNNSGNSFYLSDTILPGAQRGNSQFGDADNDGDLDIFISGDKEEDSLSEKIIFLNNGSDSLVSTDFNIDEIFSSNLQLGDFDNDNDLDFIINGFIGGYGYSRIIEDTTSIVNLKPTAPQNLIASVNGTSVLLTWNHATDDNTLPKGLTYNIYMGTTSKGIDIVSPNASVSSGFRKISRQGYIQDTAWLIKDLPAGTYYWGTQAIDNSFAPSPFSVENSFEIKNRFTEDAYTETPSSNSPAVYFDCDHDNDYDLVIFGTDKFIISENIGGSFSQSNYDTISSKAFDPIITLTPNDYNNNNLIDFSISGNYTADEILDSSIILFRYNDNFEYEIIDSTLSKSVDFEYVLWADFNNDGLQDVISSGKTTNLGVDDKPVTYLYKNQGNDSFLKISHNIRGFEYCGAVAADFDNDMDIDIVIYGKDSTTSPSTFLYINIGDFIFTEIEI